jgi:hypothetical protein
MPMPPREGESAVDVYRLTPSFRLWRTVSRSRGSPPALRFLPAYVHRGGTRIADQGNAGCSRHSRRDAWV